MSTGNRKYTNQCIAVMHAAAMGMLIERSRKNRFNQGTKFWLTLKKCPLNWNWTMYQYRIKIQ